MSCPKLAHFRSAKLGHLKALYRASVGVAQFRLDISTVRHAFPNTLTPNLGEKLYYHMGHALALKREFNEMTFLQLQHEARIQGFLGPKEKNHFTEWRLRLLLACEVRKVDNEDKVTAPDEEGEDDSVKPEPMEEDGIYVRHNGVLMRY